ncbi:MAG TPA: LuxR C-terminal-related transcriptional regulator [Vicinamibacterales bacterium]|jgi:DNA-binding NarL/FixJ family response regulator|nr:LuxR C-terminal-related transcriptional regulator [Vicinamibacterales bacterium]
MRLLLVGRLDKRARLRAELEESSFTIAAEFATLAEARASHVEADAIVFADPKGARRFEQEPFEETLTPRELDVLTLLSEGLSNKAIAERLRISDQTVKFHVAAICGKLDAANRTDAVRRGIRRGLVSL